MYPGIHAKNTPEKPAAILAFGALTTMLVAFAWRTVTLADTRISSRLLPLVPTLIACAAGYVLSKGAALRAALRAHGVEALSGFGAAGLFCESVAVAIASFPGGLNADVYKLARLRAHPRKRVLRGLVHFRVAIWIAVGLSALGAVSLRPLELGLLDLFVWAAAMALLGLAAARYCLWLAPVCWALAAVALDGLAACLLLNAVLGSGALELLATHIGAHVLGATTQLPFGLGGFDLGYAWQLRHGLSPAALATFLAVYRLSGPCLTAALGWLLLARRAKCWLFSRETLLADATQPQPNTTTPPCPPPLTT